MSQEASQEMAAFMERLDRESVIDPFLTITFDQVKDACDLEGITLKLSIDNIRMIAKHLTTSQLAKKARLS